MYWLCIAEYAANFAFVKETVFENLDYDKIFEIRDSFKVTAFSAEYEYGDKNGPIGNGWLDV